jgi:hypothetical protein
VTSNVTTFLKGYKMKNILLKRLFLCVFALSLFGTVNAVQLTVVNNAAGAISAKVKKYTVTTEGPMNTSVKTYDKENIIAGDIQLNDKIRIDDAVIPDLWHIEYTPLGSSSSYSGDKNCSFHSGPNGATITIRVSEYEIAMPDGTKCVGKFN